MYTKQKVLLCVNNSWQSLLTTDILMVVNFKGILNMSKGILNMSKGILICLDKDAIAIWVRLSNLLGLVWFEKKKKKSQLALI